MPFLTPNQQRQSTEGHCKKGHKITSVSYLRNIWTFGVSCVRRQLIMSSKMTEQYICIFTASHNSSAKGTVHTHITTTTHVHTLYKHMTVTMTYIYTLPRPLVDLLVASWTVRFLAIDRQKPSSQWQHGIVMHVHMLTTVQWFNNHSAAGTSKHVSRL